MNAQKKRKTVLMTALMALMVTATTVTRAAAAETEVQPAEERTVTGTSAPSKITGVDNWNKYEPDNELCIPTDKIGGSVIAGKMTANQPVVIWTEQPLSEEEQKLVGESLIGNPGVGNPKDFVYINGNNASIYGMTVDSEKGTVSFEEKHNWSILYSGETRTAGPGTECNPVPDENPPAGESKDPEENRDPEENEDPEENRNPEENQNPEEDSGTRETPPAENPGTKEEDLPLDDRKPDTDADPKAESPVETENEPDADTPPEESKKPEPATPPAETARPAAPSPNREASTPQANTAGETTGEPAEKTVSKSEPDSKDTNEKTVITESTVYRTSLMRNPSGGSVSGTGPAKIEETAETVSEEVREADPQPEAEPAGKDTGRKLDDAPKTGISAEFGLLLIVSALALITLVGTLIVDKLVRHKKKEK